MRKSKIDKEIDEILKDKFFIGYNRCLSHSNICNVFYGTIYKGYWEDYWRMINNKKMWLIDGYIKSNTGYFEEEPCLLRLLVVEDFKRYLKENKNDHSS